MEVVIVEIGADASVTISVEGVKGPGCQALTAGMAAALGTPTNVRPTDEMFQEASAHGGVATHRR